MIISNLENISKIIAKKLVYIIYMMYICTINLKQEQNGIHSKTNRKRKKKLQLNVGFENC